MTWNQVTDPLNNMFLSAIFASIPILFIFWALIIQRMKGYLASILTLLLAVLLSIIIYGMPMKLAFLSTFHGALYGLFPICWIIIGAVFLYNVTVTSGQFEIIKSFMASVTTDRRLQAILIAFSFGAFLEGAAGMGTPVAITAAMLVGLGFNPLYAAGICLIANTAPVAFGAIGIPIITASHVSGIPEMAISQMVGRTLPFLSLFVPFYLIVLMCGFKRALEVMPAILVSGISFAFFQWIVSNYMSPMLPDIIAGLASIVCLMVLLKFWKPGNEWHFKEEPQHTSDTRKVYSTGQIIRAWSPFIIMTVIIIAWGLQPVKDFLNRVGHTGFNITGLQNSILKTDGSPYVINPFEFNYLSASGTALLLSAFISIPLTGLSFKKAIRLFFTTLNQLKYPMITIVSVLGFAFITNNSGMSVTMALALAGTGALFPFFAPVLGWLGVFLTGSDTSSNALFSKLQQTSASAVGIDPVVAVAANATGGVTGKMISPQSIAIGAASVGLVGKESDLFRFTVKHSFIMLFAVCVITFLQAYVLTWMIPKYNIIEAAITKADPDLTRGIIYISILAVVIVTFVLFILISNRKVKGAHLANT
jgi:lactate permease